MARVKKTSRSMMLGAAFLCVMSATGGFIGAIGGIVLVLLGKSLLGLAEGLVFFMSTSVAAGTLVAALLSAVLLARNSPSVSVLPRLASSRSES